MAIKTGASVDRKLLGVFLRPSWLSGLISLLVGVTVIVSTILLTRVGNTVQQSLLGLHNVYNASSVGRSVETVTNNFAQNSDLNNVLLFLMWGSVGLLVYSIVQGVAKELHDADRLLRELEEVPASRSSILHDLFLRAIIRLVSLACWWILLRFTIYELFPYTIAAAHISALNPANAGDWTQTLLAGLGCMLAMHGLTIFLRLTFLRARLFGGDIIL
jgi:hypothetical protein